MKTHCHCAQPDLTPNDPIRRPLRPRRVGTNHELHCMRKNKADQAPRSLNISDLSLHNPPTPTASACRTNMQHDEDMLWPTGSIIEQSADPYGLGVLEHCASREQESCVQLCPRCIAEHYIAITKVCTDTKTSTCSHS